MFKPFLDLSTFNKGLSFFKAILKGLELGDKPFRKSLAPCLSGTKMVLLCFYLLLRFLQYREHLQIHQWSTSKVKYKEVCKVNFSYLAPQRPTKVKYFVEEICQGYSGKTIYNVTSQILEMKTATAQPQSRKFDCEKGRANDDSCKRRQNNKVRYLLIYRCVSFYMLVRGVL